MSLKQNLFGKYEIMKEKNDSPKENSAKTKSEQQQQQKNEIREEK